MRYVNALYSKVTQISTPIIFRGTVKNADLLPKNPLVGDMYNIEEKSIYGEAGMNVAWTGIVWDPLGPPINMGDYVKAETFKNLQSTVQKCLILID